MVSTDVILLTFFSGAIAGGYFVARRVRKAERGTIRFDIDDVGSVADLQGDNWTPGQGGPRRHDHFDDSGSDNER